MSGNHVRASLMGLGGRAVVGGAMLVAVCAGGAVSAGDVAQPQVPTDAHYRVVVATGQNAPGGGTFTDLGIPSMSGTGRVAFTAEVHGIFTQTGIWSEGHTGIGNVEAVVREFQPAPMFGGVTYGEFITEYHSPVMASNGDICFSVPLVGDDINEAIDIGIMRYAGGNLETVVMPWWPADGGGLYTQISNLPSMNNNGELVFSAEVVGGGINATNDEGVWRGAPGALEKLFREGDTISPYATKKMGGVNLNLPLINDNGVVGVQNYINDNGSIRWSMWRIGSPGVSIAELVAWQDAPSPAGPDYLGGLIGFGQLGINNANDVVFAQSIDNGAPDPMGLWLDDSGNESSVAYYGMGAPIPGTFEWIVPWSLDINGAGQVLFNATVNAPGGDKHAMFLRHADGSADVLAVAGEHAPGFPGAVEFAAWAGFGFEVLNSEGRVAFTGTIEGPGITAANNVGLWITRPEGSADLVMYKGQNLIVNGQVRTVDEMFIRTGYGPESGRRGAFNDQGQVAVHVTFTDDSQAIIVAAVPALCPGDLNGDGVVDSLDLNLVLANFGNEVEPGHDGDADIDGECDSADLNIVLGAFGESCPD